jgi:hypothetical protein
MAVVDAHGDVAVSQRAVERIIQVYEAIPPDVDRLIALRATLDQARQALSNKLRQGGAAMLLAAITGEQCYAIAEGEVYGYHVLADGQLTPPSPGPYRPMHIGDQRQSVDLHETGKQFNEQLRHRAGALCT